MSEKVASKFRNGTWFIIPFWCESYDEIVSYYKSSADWKKTVFESKYLLRYAERIGKDEELFCRFVHKGPETLAVDNYKDTIMYSFLKKTERQDQRAAFEDFLDRISLASVAVNCFSTGVGFIEFYVEYGDLPIECIIDFHYHFKSRRYHKKDAERPNLYLLAQQLIPEHLKAELFFYASSEVKHDCICYTGLKLPQSLLRSEQSKRHLYWMGRSYNTGFIYDEENFSEDISRYDFRYSPYQADKWSGSQEALTNLNYESEDPKQDYFLNNHKYDHLSNDYHFLFLIILNQRFAAIRYLEQIVESREHDSEQIMELNQKIVRLQTVFTLRVISNDMLCQNVYSRMYDIMDIDNLMTDLKDNEQQVQILREQTHLMQEREDEAAERKLRWVLAALSLLAVFSALVDAAGYLEMFPNYFLPISARWTAFIVIVLVCVLVYLMYWGRGKKKK